MFKPVELTTRQTAAAINRINNALPLFPNGSVASKFSETEIIGLLEWSLPPAWRTKFDLDGYIPTLHSKTRLVEACEAIERNEDKTTTTTKSDEKSKKKRNSRKRNTAVKKVTIASQLANTTVPSMVTMTHMIQTSVSL